MDNNIMTNWNNKTKLLWNLLDSLSYFFILSVLIQQEAMLKLGRVVRSNIIKGKIDTINISKTLLTTLPVWTLSFWFSLLRTQMLASCHYLWYYSTRSAISTCFLLHWRSAVIPSLSFLTPPPYVATTLVHYESILRPQIRSSSKGTFQILPFPSP